MADNLKQLSQQVDSVLNPAGGVGSVLVVNHNALEKGVVSKLGRYTGFPFNSQRDPVSGVIPYGSLFWNGFALNKNDSQFEIFVSSLTVDGNDFGRILETASSGDILKFKDFVGRTTTLEYISHQLDTDTSTPTPLDYYRVLVIGYPENSNYAYITDENEPCMIEIIKNTKIFDTQLISYTEPTIAANLFTFPAGEVARIQGVTYTTTSPTPITVPYATAGNERIDFIVFGTTGIVRVAGTEAVSNPASPTLQRDQILLRIVHVDDGTVVADIPSETVIDTTAMHLKGYYNAATNSPFLVDGVGNKGDCWIVTVDGTQDYGNGNITSKALDVLIYDGSEWRTFIQRTFQAVLVSGTNIKTVNGTTVLGSGNIDTVTTDQATITGNVTLDDTYNGKIVFVTSNATITIPSTLSAKFACTFRTFTGATATFVGGGGVTMDAQRGLIQAPFRMSTLIKVGATATYVLEGELKLV